MFLPPLQDICMKPVREKVPTFMTIEGADSTSGITSSDLVTQIDKQDVVLGLREYGAIQR